MRAPAHAHLTTGTAYRMSANMPLSAKKRASPSVLTTMRALASADGREEEEEEEEDE